MAGFCAQDPDGMLAVRRESFFGGMNMRMPDEDTGHRAMPRSRRLQWPGGHWLAGCTMACALATGAGCTGTAGNRHPSPPEIGGTTGWQARLDSMQGLLEQGRPGQVIEMGRRILSAPLQPAECIQLRKTLGLMATAYKQEA